MPATTEAVALALRERLPGLPLKKLHKLLYYSQGHHLAMTGHRLFDDHLSAWDMGPVVGGFWWREKQNAQRPVAVGELNESQLNTIGYVVSRYGGLSGSDLERLSHHEAPWLDADQARLPHGSAPISSDALRAWFITSADPDDLTAQLDREEVQRWLSGAVPPPSGAVSVDETEVLRGRLQAG